MKYNQISQDFLFSSYHNTKLQLNDKNIRAHTQVKFKILLWSESKMIAYFIVFLQKETKERGNIVRVLSTYHVVQTLYWSFAYVSDNAPWFGANM